MTGESEQLSLIRALGKIEGTLEGISQQLKDYGRWLVRIDARLRQVEMKAKVNGAVAGAVVSVGVILLAEAVRQVLLR